MSITVKQNILTKNDCYKSGRTITPNSMQLHTIGTAQNTASSLASYWNQSGIQACVHYCIDAEQEGLVLQFLPDNRRSWADGGVGNNNSITVELMESDYMKYTGGANYTVTNEAKFKADVTRAYNTAVQFFAMKCKEYGWDPQEKMSNGLHRVYSHDEGRRAGLSTSHVDPTHIWNRYGWTMDKFRADVVRAMNGNVSTQTVEESHWYRVRKSWDDSVSQTGAYLDLNTAKLQCPAGYTVYDYMGKAVYTVELSDIQKRNQKILSQMPDYKGLPNNQQDYINKVAEICVKLYKYTNILPSVVIAQAYLENGGGTASDALVLTKNNNLVGIKSSLLNDTWKDYTVWDGKQLLKDTPEVYNGVPVRIKDYFRVYPNYACSLYDYEMFLTWAKQGGQYKYRAVVGMKDPQKMITYIRDKGYATGVTYITSVMRIINQYNLTKYDQIAISNGTVGSVSSAAPTTTEPNTTDKYHVGSSIKNGVVQDRVGAFHVLDNAIAEAKKKGLKVFDIATGNQIYPEVKPTAQNAVSGSSTQYQVRCGIFTKKSNATKLVNNLKAAGFDAIMYQHDNQWYVQAGLFSVQSNADKLCSKIKAKGFDCVVTVI